MTRSTAMAAGTGLQQFVLAKSTAPAAVAGATPGGKKPRPTFPAEKKWRLLYRRPIFT
jgi:hypothetical protein